jgi:hypothetical protein
VNFIADRATSKVRAPYGEAKYDRLARIKAQYDPDNVFHRTPTSGPRSPFSRRHDDERSFAPVGELGTNVAVGHERGNTGKVFVVVELAWVAIAIQR